VTPSETILTQLNKLFKWFQINKRSLNVS